MREHELSAINPDKSQREAESDEPTRERRDHMTHARTLVTLGLGIVFFSQGIEGQAPMQYRNFALGSNLAAVSGLTGMTASAATTIHQRPAVLQDMKWQPSRWVAGSSTASTDPVDQIVFSFYDDQLFRVVVDYRSDRTTGMTDADIIEAISAVFGTTITRVPGARRSASEVDTESGPPIARWAGVGSAAVLYRNSSYRTAFRLIVTEPALDALAQKAAAQARRLDEQEAPQREIAEQKKAQEDGRAAADKARVANKDAFRP